MSGIQVTIPLQMMCRLVVVSQVGNNLTIPVLPERATVGTTEPRFKLPSGSVAFPEFGLAYKMSKTKLDFHAARKICLGENGQLAVIDSREKADKIFDNFNYDEWIWVGLHFLQDAAEWTTIDGKSTSNLPWASGEPNSGYRCAFLSKLKNGLGNFACTHEYLYLCEIALPRI